MESSLKINESKGNQAKTEMRKNHQSILPYLPLEILRVIYSFYKLDDFLDVSFYIPITHPSKPFWMKINNYKNCFMVEKLVDKNYFYLFSTLWDDWSPIICMHHCIINFLSEVNRHEVYFTVSLMLDEGGKKIQACSFKMKIDTRRMKFPEFYSLLINNISKSAQHNSSIRARFPEGFEEFLSFIPQGINGHKKAAGYLPADVKVNTPNLTLAEFGICKDCQVFVIMCNFN